MQTVEPRTLQEIEAPFLFAGTLPRSEGTVQLGMSHLVLVEILRDANDASLRMTSRCGVHETDL
jgi:hypothetical protein